MLKRMFRIVNFIYLFVFSKINPIGYAKYIGVRIGDNVNLRE
jgi:hypothetical protein